MWAPPVRMPTEDAEVMREQARLVRESFRRLAAEGEAVARTFYEEPCARVRLT